MKQEISEHIANAFFEKKAAKKRETSFLFFIVTSALVITVLSAGALWLSGASKGVLNTSQSVMLGLRESPYTVNFDFSDSPLKVEAFHISIPQTDLALYDRLSFSVRSMHTDIQPFGTLKIVLTNNRKETSDIYISQINNSWKKVVLPLEEFRSIHDWSHLTRLSFVLEEWNLYSKKGELLIDTIEFSKG